MWAWWRGPDADAAHAWRRLGRLGNDVANLVGAALDPALTERLMAPVADGGAGLTEEQAADWAWAVNKEGQDAVEAILAWRALGLPADPPKDRYMILMSMTAAEFSEWRDAGFTLEDIQTSHDAPLDLAVRWREGGFTPAQAVALLRADWSVKPEEALAFDAAGIDPRARLRWLELGFSAAEARAWTDVDVLPQEARVWGSLGRSPHDAREHRASGGGSLPDDVDLGWTGYGSGRSQRVYGVTDPPGTRGRNAQNEEHRPRR